MPTSIAAVWREAGEETAGVGRVEVLADRVQLEGTLSGSHVSQEVGFDEICAARLGRSASERIGGRPTLILEFANGRHPLLISSVFSFGALAELLAVLSG